MMLGILASANDNSAHKSMQFLYGGTLEEAFFSVTVKVGGAGGFSETYCHP
jgi:hypothetical protein